MKRQGIALLLVLSLVTAGCASHVANRDAGGQQKEEVADEESGFPWLWVGVGAIVLAGIAAAAIYLIIDEGVEAATSGSPEAGPGEDPIPLVGGGS